MTLNRAEQIESADKAKKDAAAKAAAAQFGAKAAMSTNTEEVVAAREPIAQVIKNSPWRENAGLTEDQLRSMERGISGVMNMELHLRLQFIKNRLNMENIGKGKKEKVSVNQLQVQAIEDYSARMLKKWGYEV